MGGCGCVGLRRPCCPENHTRQRRARSSHLAHVQAAAAAAADGGCGAGGGGRLGGGIGELTPASGGGGTHAAAAAIASIHALPLESSELCNSNSFFASGFGLRIKNQQVHPMQINRKDSTTGLTHWNVGSAASALLRENRLNLRKVCLFTS